MTVKNNQVSFSRRIHIKIILSQMDVINIYTFFTDQC